MFLFFLWRRRFGLLVATLSFVLVALIVTGILPFLPPSWIPEGLDPLLEIVDSPRLHAYTTLLELTLVLAGVALGAYHFRHQRAAAFIERFNSPDVMEMRDKIDRWLTDYEPSPLRRKAAKSPASLSPDEQFQLAHQQARLLLELRRDPELDKAVKSFANLFQELGEACENKTASPSYTKRMFDHLAPHYWGLLRFWVEDYRSRKSPTLYTRFENLARTLTKATKNEDQGEEPTTKEEPEIDVIRRELLTRSTAARDRAFVFSYGSMIYSKSRDPVKPNAEVFEGRLEGYVRAWNTIVPVRPVGSESDVGAVFLDLVFSIAGSCNGVLVELDDAQLRRLDRREAHYVRVDVTPWVVCDAGLPPGCVVHTYIGRSEWTVARNTNRKLYILSDYRRLLDEGLKERSPEFGELFWAHTQDPPQGILRLEGSYQFLDPEQNRATGRDSVSGPDSRSVEVDPRS